MCFNIFWYRKSLDKSGRGYQEFPPKIFCVTVPKRSVGESFTVAIFSGVEKVRIKEGEYQVYPSKPFCLTVPNNFIGEPFTVALISGTEKVWIRQGGVSKISVENFLSHSAENFRRGILYCCINFGNGKS